MKKLLMLRSVSKEEPVTSEYDFLVDDVVVGFANLHHEPKVVRGTGKSLATSLYIHVEEEERGKGYGKEMLLELLKQARHIGMKHVFLLTDEGNEPARKMIEHAGGEIDEKGKDKRE